MNGTSREEGTTPQNRTTIHEFRTQFREEIRKRTVTLAAETTIATAGTIAWFVARQPWSLMIAATGLLLALSLVIWLARLSWPRTLPSPALPLDEAIQRLQKAPESSEKPSSARAGEARPEGLRARLKVRGREAQHTTTDGEWKHLAELCGNRPLVLDAARETIDAGNFSVSSLVAWLEQLTRAPVFQKDPMLGFATPDDVNRMTRQIAKRQLKALIGSNDLWESLDRSARNLLKAMALAPVVSDDHADEPRSIRIHALPIEAAAASVPFPGRLHVAAAHETLSNQGFLGDRVGNRFPIDPALVPIARLQLARDGRRRRGRSYSRLVRHLALQAEHHAVSRSRANQEWFDRHHDLLRDLILDTARPQGPLRPDGRYQVELLPRGARRWWFRLAVALCRWYAAEDRQEDWARVCCAVKRVGRRSLQIRPPEWLETLWVENELGCVERRRGNMAAAEAHLKKAKAALRPWRHRGEAQVYTNLALVYLDLSQDIPEYAPVMAKDKKIPKPSQIPAGTQGARPADRAVELLEKAVPLRARRDGIGRGLTELALGVANYQKARCAAGSCRCCPAGLRLGSGPDEDQRPEDVDERQEELLQTALLHLENAASALGQGGERRGRAIAFLNLMAVNRMLGAANQARQNGRAAEQVLGELERDTGRSDAEASALLHHHRRSLEVETQPTGALDTE